MSKNADEIQRRLKKEELEEFIRSRQEQEERFWRARNKAMNKPETWNDNPAFLSESWGGRSRCSKVNPETYPFFRRDELMENAYAD